MVSRMSGGEVGFLLPLRASCARRGGVVERCCRRKRSARGRGGGGGGGGGDGGRAIMLAGGGEAAAVSSPSSSPSLPLASRVWQLESEGAYAVMAAAAEVEHRTGEPVVHLEIGQPTYPTPQHIVDAGVAAIQRGETKYSNPSGVMELKEAIAEHVSASRGVHVRPQQVVVGPGAKPGLFFTTLALVQPGDEVLYPDPGFPTYHAMTLAAGATPVPVPMRKDGSSLDMDALERLLSARSRLIVLNSPGNPTGGVMPLDDVVRVAKLARERDLWVLSDEIYSRLVYTEEGVPSVLSQPDMAERTVLVDGFSKTYCMTGWRLGWAVMPEALALKVELLLVHSVGCTATFTQSAGLAALRGPQDSLSAMLREYNERRRLVVDGLNAIDGVRCPQPAGAFYAFFDVSSFGLSSREMASRLLNDGLVAVLPGTDFGAQGEGYLRLSYVCDREQLERGLERISRVLATLR